MKSADIPAGDAVLRRPWSGWAGVMLLALSAGCVTREYREVSLPAAAPPIEVGVMLAEGNPPKAPAGRKYRGTVETVERGGKTSLVNRVTIEDYSRGVINGEVSPTWPAESLKAMSIVIRSYAFNRWQASSGSAQHLFADVRSQEYCGLNCEDARSNAAVDETSGLVLVYNGEPVQAFSHACCGGSTEDSFEVWGGTPSPVFRGRRCDWCRGSRHWGPWTLVLEKTTLARRLAAETGWGMNIDSVEVEARNQSGRVKTVAITAGGKKFRMSGARFRSLVGWGDIRSARFEVSDGGSTVSFRGTGWGHGVGLCQEGARKMAEEGNDYEAILAFYFPGAEIWRLPRQ